MRDLNKKDLEGFIIKSRVASDSKYGINGDRKTLDVEIDIMGHLNDSIMYKIYKNGELVNTANNLTDAIEKYNLRVSYETHSRF